jgi:hypothetical protein
MLRMILGVAFLLVVPSAVVGQAEAGHAGQEGNLRGLSGVRLVIMFGRADALDGAQRPEVLKMLEADTTAKLQKAGIPLLRFNDQIEKAGSPQLIVMVTLDKPNGFVHPLVTEVKLLQRVRLARDPAIETDAVTWDIRGVGGPKLDIAMMRRQVASEIDRFIQDYMSVNPNHSASLGKEKPKNPTH